MELQAIHTLARTMDLEQVKFVQFLNIDHKNTPWLYFIVPLFHVYQVWGIRMEANISNLVSRPFFQPSTVHHPGAEEIQRSFTVC